MASLNIPETRERYSAVEEAYEDTYKWLLTNRVTLVEWLTDIEPSRLYWICGKVGSGKSTLFKYLLEHPQLDGILSGPTRRSFIRATFFFNDRRHYYPEEYGWPS